MKFSFDAISGVQSIVDDATALSETQQQTWQQLEGLNLHQNGENSLHDGSITPRAEALQRRFTHRRAQTSTVSVVDLQKLSSMLCAS